MKELAGDQSRRALTIEIDNIRTMSNTNIIIPNDIVIEIFSRVPAKSLIRLRWACKYWFDLITRDPAFIKKHYLHHHSTNTNDGDGDDRIISNTSFWVSNSKTVVYTMNFGDVVNNDHDNKGTLVNMDCYNLPFSNLDYNDYLQFYGSCNGLVLLCLHSKKLKLPLYVLWNPCTREVKELPHEPSNSYPVNDSYWYGIVGFSYDHTIDDYKVMRIIFYSSQLLDDNADIDHLNMDIGVYTLGSNSWSTKIVADPSFTAYSRKQIRELGLFVNGALHWTREWEGIGTITSFDITKEEFREMEGPNKEELREIEEPINFISEPKFNLLLSVLNGCLCICQMPHFKENYVIWMMKDYGLKDSWTKLFTINMEKVLAAPGLYGAHRYYSEPFEQYSMDGGILMVFNRNVRGMIMVACDSKKNAKARFIYSIQDGKYRFVNGTYIESLVSLNSGMYLILAAGSRTPTFRKQDLLEYDVKVERDSREKYLVRKGISRTEAIEEEEDNVQGEIFGEERYLKNGIERRRRRRRR